MLSCEFNDYLTLENGLGLYDDVRLMVICVLLIMHMGAAFEYLDKVHLHSALEIKLPKEFRLHRAAHKGLAHIERMSNCKYTAS